MQDSYLFLSFCKVMWTYPIREEYNIRRAVWTGRLPPPIVKTRRKSNILCHISLGIPGGLLMTVIDDATCRFQLSFSSAFSVSHAPASTPSTVAGSELYPLTPPYPTHPTTTTTSSAFSEPPPPNLIVIIFYFLNKSFLQVILNITLLVIPKTKKMWIVP